MKRHIRYPLRWLLKENWVSNSRADSLIRREQTDYSNFLFLQDLYLLRTLTSAVKRIPAYKQFAGKIPKKSIRQFLVQNFPILDKDVFLSERKTFYPHNGISLPWWSVGKTSGTSGTPLDVFRDYNSTIWEHAFHLQHWNWAKCRKRGVQAVLRGDIVAKLNQNRPPYWYYDTFGRQLILSTRHLNESTVQQFTDAISNVGATQLRAYPSAAYELARLVEKQQLNLRFRSIITGSEILYPAQREMIERILGGKIYDFYGMAERVAFGCECQFGKLHIHPEYSFVEIVDANGNQTDGEGFIVGTTFHNAVMPLIRYRLNDAATWSQEPCPCGCTYPSVARISGKIEDTLFDLDGRPVSPSLITFAFKGVHHLQRSQVAQTSNNHWEIRIVPEVSYQNEDGLKLLSNIEKLVSNRLNVSLRVVPSIPNLPSGKYKWITQESQNISHKKDALL